MKLRKISYYSSEGKGREAAGSGVRHGCQRVVCRMSKA